MQINYDYYDDRRAFAAGFYNSPSLDNSIQDVNVPVLYSPYGTATWWPDGSTPYVSPADVSVAPNSGTGVTVASALSGVRGLGDVTSSLAPSDLVAPMPSIIKPRTPAGVSATCAISNWVQNNTGLAILAALGVFALAHGGKK